MHEFVKDKLVNPLCKLLLPFFSLLVAGLCLNFFIKFVLLRNTTYLYAMLITPYALPLLTWRVLNLFYPLKEGRSFIAGPTFSPWLSSFRIQEIYLKFPFLEKTLMLVPFLYNVWLRAWGAKIGKRVIFAPGVVINDRPGVEIGDYVYFGDGCYLSSHLVLEKDKKFICYYKKIRIESHSFIGAFTTFAPGATVKAGSRVNTFSFFRLNSEKAESFDPGATEIEKSRA